MIYLIGLDRGLRFQCKLEYFGQTKNTLKFGYDRNIYCPAKYFEDRATSKKQFEISFSLKVIL